MQIFFVPVHWTKCTVLFRSLPSWFHLLFSQARQNSQHSESSHPSIPKEFQLDLDMIEMDQSRVCELPDLVQHKLDELLEPIMIPEPK